MARLSFSSFDLTAGAEEVQEGVATETEVGAVLTVSIVPAYWVLFLCISYLT